MRKILLISRNSERKNGNCDEIVKQVQAIFQKYKRSFSITGLLRFEILRTGCDGYSSEKANRLLDVRICSGFADGTSAIRPGALSDQALSLN